MKIVFFGTSHGMPEPNRRCSATMIEIDEKRYFIDMGTSVAEGLADRKIPLSAINAVFVTHMHGDHTNGLIHFLDLCSWAYTDTNPQIYLPGDIDGAKSAMSSWIAVNNVQMREFDFRAVTVGVIYDDGVLRVSAYQTKHTSSSYSYLLEAEGKRVLFTGDLRSPLVDFPISVLDEPLDLAVCEGAHFEATQYVSVFKNGNPKQVCFNHCHGRYIIAVYQAVKELSDKTDAFVASDGMEIIL